MANLGKHAGQFWLDIRENLTDKLAAIQKDGAGIIQRSEQSIIASKEALMDLRTGLNEYIFSDQEEEIAFYRTIKPSFYSSLIFHTAVYKTELAMPPATKADQEAYLNGQMDQIREFFDANRFLYQYIRSGQTYLDDKLFSKPPQNAVYAVSIGTSPDDLADNTSFSFLVGRMMANEELQGYLTKAIEDLNKAEGSRIINRPSLVWTESKTGLIELAYALHAIGSVNNGKADLKEIIDGFQQLFNVSLGNYPRTFQEILARKTGYTNFLDKCRDKLLLRIQTIEDKYIK